MPFQNWNQDLPARTTSRCFSLVRGMKKMGRLTGGDVGVLSTHIYTALIKYLDAVVAPEKEEEEGIWIKDDASDAEMKGFRLASSTPMMEAWEKELKSLVDGDENFPHNYDDMLLGPESVLVEQLVTYWGEAIHDWQVSEDNPDNVWVIIFNNQGKFADGFFGWDVSITNTEQIFSIFELPYDTSGDEIHHMIIRNGKGKPTPEEALAHFRKHHVENGKVVAND